MGVWVMLIITQAVAARVKEVQMQPTRLQDLALGKMMPFMLASLGVLTVGPRHRNEKQM